MDEVYSVLCTRVCNIWRCLLFRIEILCKHTEFEMGFVVSLSDSMDLRHLYLK